MQPFPGKRSVIILDNASIHHSVRFINMITAAGGMVLFTPPYCFNLTPLDNGAFGALVRWMRQKEFDETEMRDVLDRGFRECVSRKAARAYFRGCGYGPIV